MLELLRTLAKIPAPSNDEGRRAVFCRDTLKKWGADNVYIDEADNVILPIGDMQNDICVFMAHSDVVFPDTEELPLYWENGRIYCPGIGDDTAHVVCLMYAAKHIIENKLTPEKGGVLLVINSGEEGLGNLRGCREIMRVYGDRVREFVTFDGGVPVIHQKPVGSRRFEIEIKTEGGHSYQDFGNKNAIACLSSLIDRLYKTDVPKIGRTTYNVGLISGGTSVNTVAQNAKALFEFRSDEQKALDIMQAAFDREIALTEGDVTVTVIGDRPCEGDVDKEKLAALTKRCAEAVKKHFCCDIIYKPGSTDCNIPSSMGIPSVCVGLVKTAGAHTREEYIEADSLAVGCELALEIIMEKF